MMICESLEISGHQGEECLYLDTAQFHPELSDEDNALIYGITGGILDRIYDAAVGSSLSSYMGLVFEDICRFIQEKILTRKSGL